MEASIKAHMKKRSLPYRDQASQKEMPKVSFLMEESSFPLQNSWFPTEKWWFTIEKCWFYDKNQGHASQERQAAAQALDEKDGPTVLARGRRPFRDAYVRDNRAACGGDMGRWPQLYGSWEHVRGTDALQPPTAAAALRESSGLRGRAVGAKIMNVV